MQVWCKCAPNLPTKCKFGVWCKFGASLVQVCTKLAHQVQDWCKFGASLHQTCTPSASLVQVRCKFGASLKSIVKFQSYINLQNMPSNHCKVPGLFCSEGQESRAHLPSAQVLHCGECPRDEWQKYSIVVATIAVVV